MVESNIQIAHEGKALSNNINVKLEKRDTIFVDTFSGENEMLNFAGVVIDGNNTFVSFPKHFESNDATVKKDIQLLFSTIMKHYQENQNLYFAKTANLKTNYPFNAFFDIYNYYAKFGIYHEKIVETRRGYNGNVSWKDTIKNSSKVVSEKGILFLPLRIKKVKRKQVLISECMAYAIDYTLQHFSLFLNLPRVGGSSLQKNFLENKNAILRELYSLKGEIFKDINKKLLSDLILFFEQVPHGGTYYLKHYTFSSVWEKMVENYLNYHFVKIDSGKLIFEETRVFRNSFGKATFYPNAANMGQNIQPDHYLGSNGEQYIFDAKYYNQIEGINYKQAAYYFFLENYSDDASNHKKKYAITHNALILPGNKEQRVHFRFNPKFNSEEKSFVIYEYYLDCKKAMESYLNEV